MIEVRFALVYISRQDFKEGAMSGPFQPAIDALRQQLVDDEKKVAETKKLINRLSEVAGLPPPYGDVEEVSRGTISQIRQDTFYGKKLFTAVREYLEMRRAANLGPAETREIYDAITKGGYQFETTDANNAMTGMRQTLRKNSAMFHRLPNNAWGLTAWYENIKTSKGSKSDAAIQDDESQIEADQDDADAEPASEVI